MITTITITCFVVHLVSQSAPTLPGVDVPAHTISLAHFGPDSSDLRVRG
eukprot:CAMPEP_0172032856 /NCGR_PEP_ID=MMETSP1041-20130122/20110_1 /TAXON_ID=464988 /ORGANISM="Hemiselmis andersenii, Strain CCMP439" /LENGTH=48 /DNA_ID= /DNA_START= /DNA_END= /DNA_ORIENTATION=